jgi:hypothetical protein
MIYDFTTLIYCLVRSLVQNDDFTEEGDYYYGR